MNREPTVALAGDHAGDPEIDPLASPGLRRSLPGLLPALDPDLMRERLQEGLCGPRHAIERCVPGKAMYLGPTGCTLRYQLVVRNVGTGGLADTLVLGRLFTSDKERARYERGLQPLLAQLQGRDDVDTFASLHDVVPSLGLVVHAFPVDGALPTLVHATDVGHMPGVLGRALGVPVDRCRVALGKYSRRDRCVLRYEAEMGGKVGARSGPPRLVFGKVYGDRTGETSNRVLTTLYELLPPAGHPRHVAVPSPLGYRPELRLALLGALPGAPVGTDLLVVARPESGHDGDQARAGSLIGAAARAAAALHGSAVPLGPRRTLGGDLAALRGQLVELSVVWPGLASRLDLLLEAVDAAAGATEPMPPCFNHGDFTLSQLLQQDGTLGVVDFDSACQGEPALDVGHFLAYLRLSLAKSQLPPSERRRLTGELSCCFLSAYVTAVGSSGGERDLEARARLFTMVSLARIALHAWRNLKGSRARLALALLEEELACHS